MTPNPAMLSTIQPHDDQHTAPLWSTLLLLPFLAGVALLILGRGWPFNLLLLLPLAPRLAAWWNTGGRRVGWAALLLPAVVLGGAILPGMLVSANPDASLSRLMSLIAGVAVYYAAITLRGWERKAAPWALVAGLAAFCTLSILALDWSKAPLFALPIYNLLPHIDLGLTGSGVLAGGDQLNPRMVGGVCAILLVPAFGAALLAQTRPLRYLAFATAAIGLATLALTQAVEGLIGLLPATLVFLLATRRERSARPVSLLYGGLLALLALPLLIGALNLPPLTGAMLLDNSPAVRVEARLEIWNRAFAMFADGPLVGVGLNNFPFVFHNAYPGFIMDDRAWAIAVSAHNGYLQAAADAGILGLASFAAILLAALRWWRRADPTASTERTIAAAALAGIAAFAGFNLIDSLTLGAKAAPAVWLLLGLLAATPASAPIAAPTLRELARLRLTAGLAALGLAVLALLLIPAIWSSGAVVATRQAVAANRPLGPDRPTTLLPNPAYVTAQASVATALEAEPANPALLYQQGLLAYTFGDNSQAAISFARFEEAAGVRDPAAYFQGWAFFAQGRDEDALAAWRQTGSGDVLNAAGNSMASRNPTLAAAAYRAADAAAPGHIEPLLRLAELQARNGQQEAALDDYRALQSRFPQQADAYVGEGRILRGAGRAAEASAALQRGIGAGAAPLWLLYYELSQALAAQPDLAGALDYARRAAAAAPGNESVAAWLADLEGRVGP